MSTKGKLKRNFSNIEDYDSKSDSEAETEEFSLRRPAKKKKICIDSESESESALLDKDSPNKEEEVSSASDEDEPLGKVAGLSKGRGKEQKVLASCNTSDDELVAKHKISVKDFKTNERHLSLDSGCEKNGSDATSDENRTRKLKVHTSSDSPDDEPLGAKSKNLSIHSDASKNSSHMSSSPEEDGLDATSDEDKPIAKVAKASTLEGKSKKMQYSSDSSDDEYLANKIKKTAKNKENETVDSTERLHSGPENEPEATSDEDETISQISASTKSKALNTSLNDSEDEPLAVKSRKSSNHLKTNKNIKNLDSGSEESISEISSDEEPLSKMAKFSKTRENSKADTSASDSEDEPLVVKNKGSKQKLKSRKDENHKSQSIMNGNNSSEEEEPIAKVAKRSNNKERSKKSHNSSSSSDDEPLSTKLSVTQKSGSQESGDLSSDEEEKPISKLSKRSKEKANKQKKDNSSSNAKIEHLKKYLRVAGIHIQSYDKFFQNCKSIKSKVEKLLDLLHEKGLKGRPTIEKCKKLKKKIETKKEIAELDISNIIKSEGRPKRGAGGKIIEKVQNTGSSPAAKKFARLRDIIDSEESD